MPNVPFTPWTAKCCRLLELHALTDDDHILVALGRTAGVAFQANQILEPGHGMLNDDERRIMLAGLKSELSQEMDSGLAPFVCCTGKFTLLDGRHSYGTVLDTVMYTCIVVPFSFSFFFFFWRLASTCKTPDLPLVYSASSSANFLHEDLPRRGPSPRSNGSSTTTLRHTRLAGHGLLQRESAKLHDRSCRAI